MTAQTKLNIFIENAYEEYQIDEAAVYADTVKIARFIFSDAEIINKSCLKGYKYKSVSFDIVFVNNSEIQRINCEYRDKDAAADVITFAMFADSAESGRFIIDGDINLGEIIISLDKIKAQSEENKVSFKEELYFIIPHGILHLLGFDHQNQHDYDYMVLQQKRAEAEVL